MKLLDMNKAGMIVWEKSQESVTSLDCYSRYLRKHEPFLYYGEKAIRLGKLSLTSLVSRNVGQNNQLLDLVPVPPH